MSEYSAWILFYREDEVWEGKHGCGGEEEEQGPCVSSRPHGIVFLQEEPSLRKTSIVLFGNLAKFSSRSGEDAYFEQILYGLVTLLLHLQDPKPEVIKVRALARRDHILFPSAGKVPQLNSCPSLQACKFALRMCGPTMSCPVLCEMFQNHLHEERSLHYGEFMNDVCKHLVSDWPPGFPALLR